MKFITPSPEELSYLRADPLLWEQELDVRPEAAEAISRATGIRAGRVYLRSGHDHLYALELADLGRGRPSMAMVFGHWDRYEPRPPEHEIDADLLDFMLWVAEVSGLDPGCFPGGRTRRYPPGLARGIGCAYARRSIRELPGFPYEPRYEAIEGLRLAYVEQGQGDPILMLHGEPTWGYLYRHMIPPLAEMGRVIVPDLIGFGRSDKPVEPNAYSFKSHVRWMRKWITALNLERITLVCQDWGGSIGLRLLAQDAGTIPEIGGHEYRHRDRIESGRRVHALAGFFPTGEGTGYPGPDAQCGAAKKINRRRSRRIRRPLSRPHLSNRGPGLPQAGARYGRTTPGLMKTGWPWKY